MNESRDDQRSFSPAVPMKNNGVKKWVIRAAVLLGLIGAAFYAAPRLIYIFSHESTDNAYVTATITPVSSEVKGKVARAFVEDNQEVKAGDPIFEIERGDYSAYKNQAEKALDRLVAEENQMKALLQEGKESLQESKAKLGSAKAKEEFASKEKERYEELGKKHLVSDNQREEVVSHWRVAQAGTEAAAAAVSKAEATVRSLEAQLKTQAFKIGEAKAALNLAEINLSRTLITAPASGRIAKKNVQPGKYLQPGQPVLSLVEDDLYIVANFKETQIRNIRIGQPVEIKVDAYPGVTFRGRIDSFQPGTGAVFSLLPAENATGNFVKVVQRVPVKITFDKGPDPAHPLWAGLSVTPYVDIRAEN